MTIRSSLSCLILLLPFSLSAQINASLALKDSAVFRSKIKGYVVDIIKWNDSLGSNHLILTETPEKYIETDTFSGSNKYLYVYHFLDKDSLLWRIMDHVKDCPVDITVEFRDKATTITDLDKNGIAETWIMYSLACRGDISPSTLKLIMHQGTNKHIIRGTSQYSKDMIENEYGGKYVLDISFSGLSQLFKDFAGKLWLANLYDN